MVTEDYVSFETAKVLKDKGFVIDNITILVGDDNNHFVSGKSGYNFLLQKGYEVYPAPTLQMAMKWFRENHRIIIVVDYDYDCTKTCYCYKIYKLQEYDRPESVPIKGFYYKDGKQIEEVVGNSDHIRSRGEYAKYEEACEAAIKYCLENLI